MAGSTNNQHEGCELCQTTGSLWATKKLRQPEAAEGDVVWFQAEAKEAFSRTDFADGVERGGEMYQRHERAFLSGAMGAFESQRTTEEFGQPIQ